MLLDESSHMADTMKGERRRFARWSTAARSVAGSPFFTAGLMLAVVTWLAIGPLVDYSMPWELAATAGVPTLALVLLAVLQHSQNQDDRAVHLKLNEIIRALDSASDRMIGIEEGAETDLRRLLGYYRRRSGRNAPDGQAVRDGHSQERRPGRRHRRRQAMAELDPERSFVFRSPGGHQSVRAANLALFTQLAASVDDETWSFHLYRGDYSRWLEDVIGDEALAAEARDLQRDGNLASDESRRRLIAAINEHYG